MAETKQNKHKIYHLLRKMSLSTFLTRRYLTSFKLIFTRAHRINFYNFLPGKGGKKCHPFGMMVNSWKFLLCGRPFESHLEGGGGSKHGQRGQQQVAHKYKLMMWNTRMEQSEYKINNETGQQQQPENWEAKPNLTSSCSGALAWPRHGRSASDKKLLREVEILSLRVRQVRQIGCGERGDRDTKYPPLAFGWWPKTKMIIF